METIIGLDLSLTSTGFSYQDTVGILSSPKKGVSRLDDLCEQMTKLMTDIQSSKVAIIEGYSFASRNSQAHAIGELGGVIRLTLYRLGIPFVDVPPTCRAKFATGKGNASKNEVISALSARTGIVWSGKGADDMADAWILEEMGRVQVGDGRFEWPKHHTEALEKVDWSPLLERRKGVTNESQ